MARDPENYKRWRLQNAEKNREKRRLYMIEWRQKQKEHRAAYKKAYNEAHANENAAAKRAWDEENKEHRISYSRQYLERNRTAIYVRNQKRKALKRAATIGPIDVSLLLKDMTCGICEEAIKGAFHVDHIIPLAKGGAHTQENLQLAHPVCNMQKSDKLGYTKKDPGGSFDWSKWLESVPRMDYQPYQPIK